MDNVHEIYLAIHPDADSGELVMRTATHPYAAAMECFSRSLGKVSPEQWGDKTELITIVKVFSMEQNPLGFCPGLIGTDDYGNPKIPQGASYKKIGAVVISLAEGGDDISFNIKFMEVATTINDITAN
tara:strand:+ start:602 stop:985 length:384 start_codon:yes stop_codon:yes gene_type:complete